ncbi:hypothetical protein Tco_0781232 [Tanacetum coccineum]
MQHQTCNLLPNDPKCVYRHKGKRQPNRYSSIEVRFLWKTVIQKQARRDKDYAKRTWHSLLSISRSCTNLPTTTFEPSSNSRNKTEDTTPRYNKDNQSGQFGNQRTMTVAGARETVGSPVEKMIDVQNKLNKGFHFKAEQVIGGLTMRKSSSLIPIWNRYKTLMNDCVCKCETTFWSKLNPVTTHKFWRWMISIVIPDSSNLCSLNVNQVDQNAAECVDERAALANLIANLTLDTEENKTVLKQLKKANASLTQELKECKTNLDESSMVGGGYYQSGLVSDCTSDQTD